MKTLGEVIAAIEALQSDWEDQGFSFGDDLDGVVADLKLLKGNAQVAAAGVLRLVDREPERAQPAPKLQLTPVKPPRRRR